MQVTSLIDHVNLPVSSIKQCQEFYTAILSELGLSALVLEEGAIGFGRESWELGIVEEKGVIIPIHIAFTVSSNAAVSQFYTTALAAGGLDNGAPGLRPEYGATYFAAYLLDFDGHNIEAVCR